MVEVTLMVVLGFLIHFAPDYQFGVDLILGVVVDVCDLVDHYHQGLSVVYL